MAAKSKSKTPFSFIWADKNAVRSVIGKISEHLPENVQAICRRLSQNNTPSSEEATFALEALVMHAMNPEQAKFRQSLAKAIAEGLSSAPDSPSLCRLLEALQRLAVSGTEAAIAATLSKGEPVFTYALNALRTIRTPEAYAAMEQGFATLRKPALRIACMIAALENPAPDAKIQTKALSLAEEETYALPLRAALARRGSWEAFPLYLESLIAAQTRTERAEALKTLAAFFRNSTAPAELRRQFAMEFLRTEPGMPSVSALMQTYGETPESREVLFAAFRKGDEILQHAVCEYFVRGFAGTRQTEDLVAFAAQLKEPAAKAIWIAMLGRRGDVAAAVYVRSQLQDSNPVVRLAAWKAAAAWDPSRAQARAAVARLA